MRRRGGEEVLPAAFEYHGASAFRGVLRASERYCDSCQGDFEGKGVVEWDLPEAFDEGAFD